MVDGKSELLQRPHVPELDAILGKPFQVLDDGLVRVIDYMGDEAAIVQAARVSYGKGTKKVSEDRGLIRYLLRHRHTTPFEMNELKLHVRVPMDAWRQWIRHRTASVNEYSTRYSVAIDAKQKTDPSEWRLQAGSNRQGSDGFLSVDQGLELSLGEQQIHTQVQEEYNRRVDMGVAREQARKDLPLSTYTEAYWKIDLHNLLHFLGLRMDSHAQKEIREYATVIGEEIVSQWVPTVWEAFQEYRMDATFLTAKETKAVQLVAGGHYRIDDPQLYVAAGIIREDQMSKRNRERAEAQEKLTHLFKQYKSE